MPEGTQEPEAQAAEPTQDLAPESQPHVQPASEPSQGTGPWADDLATMFQDEAVRTQVDGFLRQKVQPYVTQLEGQRGNEEAERLFNDLQEDPADTYLSITGALFGDEAAEQVQAALYEYYGEDEGEPGTEPEDGELDPRVAALIEADEERKQREGYESELARLKASHAGEEIDEDLLAPFVISADGDMDAAYEGYRKYVARLSQTVNPGEEQEQVTFPVLGSDTTAQSAPPVAKKYTSIDEAMEDTLAEIRAKNSAPAVVGSV